jgi:hypothetical protein
MASRRREISDPILRSRERISVLILRGCECISSLILRSAPQAPQDEDGDFVTDLFARTTSESQSFDCQRNDAWSTISG